MKKLKFDKDQRLYREDFFQLLRCPLSNTKKIEVFCGPWCAWFDIEDIERLKLNPPKNPNGFSLEQFEVYRAVTCKGIPIGELVEEEVEE